ncbi:Heterokaryon incompatibility protein (HET) domain containing protein [Rhypophila decipiens]
MDVKLPLPVPEPQAEEQERAAAAAALKSTFSAPNLHRYRYNTLDSFDWGTETRFTWGIFRNDSNSDSQIIPLCGNCRTKGLGSTNTPVSVMCPPVEGIGRSRWEWVSVSYLSKIRSAGKGKKGCAFCYTVLYLGFRELQKARLGAINSLRDLSDFEPSGDWDLRYAFQGPRCVKVGAIHWASGDGELVEQFYITVEGESDRGKDPVCDQDDIKSIIRPQWVSFMRARLDSCLSSDEGVMDQHALCRREPTFRPDWPRRVLKVTGDKVVLVDFHETMVGEYAALSYCWGSADELQRNPPVTATSSTTGYLRSGVLVSDLPLTIRQAVAVCSCLRIQYIWVDALCIIQDDNADWEAEARKMATVYSMAKLTIIAGSSTSCHSGFLDADLGGAPFEISPGDLGHDLPRTPIRLVARQTNTSNFHFNLEDFVNFDPTHEVIPTKPHNAIDHRGWTFQEEFLSTRYIKFTKDDIQWQCREDAGCLCQQEVQKHERRALYEDLWATSTPPKSSTAIEHHLPAGPASSRATDTSNVPFLETSRDYWQEIVRDFSRRRFTNPTDKLLAFSGIASCLAPNMQSPYRDRSIDSTNSYLAGLWSNMILDGGALSWRCYESAEGRPYETYIAPSFSWASVDVGVVYDQGSHGRDGFCNEKRLFNLIGTERRLLSVEEGDFRRLGPGCSVTLSGALLPCFVGLHRRRGTLRVTGIIGLSVNRGVSGSPYVWFDCGLSRVVFPDGTVTLQRSTSPQTTDTTNVGSGAVTEVHIFILRSMTFYRYPESGFEGLILGKVQHVKNQAPGADGYHGYQRLGYIRIEGKELEVDKYQSVVTIY